MGVYPLYLEEYEFQKASWEVCFSYIVPNRLFRTNDYGIYGGSGSL